MQRIIRRIAPDRQMPELITGLREILAGLFRAPMQTVLRGAGANLVALILIPRISGINIPHPPASILHTLDAGRQNAVFLHRVVEHDLWLRPVNAVG